MADFNEGDFAELIKEVTKIELPDLEKTIFSIGGRGHYENPTSDILAFYHKHFRILFVEWGQCLRSKVNLAILQS